MGYVGELYEAKKEGKLNETLLDRRAKVKSDKVRIVSKVRVPSS
jgi:hypothetical protein